MKPLRVIVLLVFIALIATPMVFRPADTGGAGGSADAPASGGRIIIITPHNDQIRTEFGRAFSLWHEEKYGEPVEVVWNAPGGTTEIRRMLIAQYQAALESGIDIENDYEGTADLAFGGGSYEYNRKLKPGVSLPGDPGSAVSITQPLDFDPAWLEAVYGENRIGNEPLYDTEQHWFGTVVSAFGIIYNRDALAQCGVDEPAEWRDLCHPSLRGWVALANPSMSGSITKAFDTVLQRHGWEEGWQILRRAGANARYFAVSSPKVPIDVSQGEAAVGVCIDFYGRYQVNAIARAGDPDRLGYIDPKHLTAIDPDPIAMLRGAPNPVVAKRFIEFCLSPQAQALWQFPAEETNEDGIGPVQYELRRLPILRSMYDGDAPDGGRYFRHFIDQVNPYELASPMDMDRSYWSFISIIFNAAVVDNHDALLEAWSAIAEHPAYPRDSRLKIVTAADVDDPTLKQMLELLDAMPAAKGVAPDGELVEFTMDTTESRNAIQAAWDVSEFWHREANPRDVVRVEFADFFRRNYDEIVKLGKSG